MNKQKFKVGDIVNSVKYPGRDVWQTVGKITEVNERYYVLEKIQFKRQGENWFRVNGRHTVCRNDWEEDQTSLFRGPTLKDEEDEKLYLKNKVAEHEKEIANLKMKYEEIIKIITN